MVNAVNIPKAYSEVYAFIDALGNDFKSKVPSRIIDTIRDNRDINYKPEFDKNQTIKQEDISHEALALIAALNLQYWCTNEKEKEQLKNIYQNNSQKEKEKYGYENLFRTNIEKESATDSVAMVEYKESIFVKIWNWFKRTV